MVRRIHAVPPPGAIRPRLRPGSRMAVSIRPGLSLVEVVVATVVLGAGAVLAAGALHNASRLLNDAIGRQAAATLAAQTLDSLALVAEPADGRIVDGPRTVSWTVARGPDHATVTLTVVYPRATGEARGEYRIIHHIPVEAEFVAAGEAVGEDGGAGGAR